ncbi:cytochrome-c peroxidase [Motilimonas pumila]|uniref:Cytochrome C peroxidase n=1 Tax=Motilimonas pumila TaxID=2303987 RepID=A0A418YII8_9GAMM|nr:cytochrome c peroxidase [Motilimonas pumila]RJG50458.1 cytochrome C peroxidase [Motilimonas pumila]
MNRYLIWVSSLALSFSVIGCGGGGSTADENSVVANNDPASDVIIPANVETDPINGTDTDNVNTAQNIAFSGSELDQTLRLRLEAQGINQSPAAHISVVDINEPLAQLGKKLFYSKSLSGDLDTACASCHHPQLGGADALSLTVGVAAVAPEVLGTGRENATALPEIGRNSPTVFNSALLDQGLFWDSRIARLANGGISTPDSGWQTLDPQAGNSLLAAQARFPVTATAEMRGQHPGLGDDNPSNRQYLAARLSQQAPAAGDLTLNLWLSAFQQGFESSADAAELITFDNIALALAHFERSMIFVDSPWQRYIAGNLNAINEQQKQGALLFYSTPQQGGAGCSGCHSGNNLTDQRHHTVAFPQFGPGAGDGVTADDDFGRERTTGDRADRYRFRTPSLHNVALTAPYGHAGSYLTLQQVVRHYANPRGRVNDFFQQQQSCQLPQFEDLSQCASIYPNSQLHSRAALAKLGQEQNESTSLLPNINLNNDQVASLVAFLESLTDDCLTQPNCLQPWIANANSDNPDDQVLIGTDSSGAPL